MPVRKWGSANIVATTTQYQQFDPSITTLNDGGYLIVWQHIGLLGNNFIYGQRYDASGARIGNEFSVENNGGNIDPSAVGLSGGGFIISYAASTAGSLYDVQAALYDGNGSVISSPGVAASPGRQQQSELTRNGTGYAAVYTDFNSTSGDVFLKRFDAAGAFQGLTAVNTLTSNE